MYSLLDVVTDISVLLVSGQLVIEYSIHGLCICWILLLAFNQTDFNSTSVFTFCLPKAWISSRGESVGPSYVFLEHAHIPEHVYGPWHVHDLQIIRNVLKYLKALIPQRISFFNLFFQAFWLLYCFPQLLFVGPASNDWYIYLYIFSTNLPWGVASECSALRWEKSKSFDLVLQGAMRQVGKKTQTAILCKWGLFCCFQCQYPYCECGISS